MQTESIPIAPLTRVSLDLGLPAAGQSRGLRPFTFIVGIGSAGLAPFEYALLGKKAGDRVSLEIDPSRICSTFEHLQPPLDGLAFGTGSLVIEARVVAIAPAESREIIKAMAAATGGCGDHCDCGCSIHPGHR